MQTNIAAIKNIKYERLRNRTKASVPSASLDFPLGGVLGHTKLSNPKATETKAAILKVSEVFSIFN